MSETVNGYEDLLDDVEHRWRNRLIGLAVLGALLAGGAYALWAMVLGGGGSSAAEIQTATVQRGSISQTFSTTGTAVAQSTADLSFGQSGTVSAVNVTLGQKVKQGDVLAEIEPDELQSAVTTAELNLASAQAKLDTLLAGPTTSELASADQSLLQAQANLVQANRALQDLMDGPSATDLLSAEQAVASAQSQLDKAEQSRTNLYTTSDDAVTAAEDAVSKAEDALTNAQRTAANAADSLATSAKISLLSAAATYCDTKDHLRLTQICGDNIRMPLTDSTVRELIHSISEEITASGEITAAGVGGDDVQQDAAPTPEATPEPTPEPEPTATPESTAQATAEAAGGDLIQATTALISANTSYKNALASKTSADNGVASAQADLETAKNNLEEAKKGPSSADIASADNAVASAQLSLDDAKAKLAELKQGPTQDDLDDAQSSVNMASAALEAAKAKRDEVYAGSTAADIELQRGQVQQAQLSVEKARKNLDKAKIIAPFDGTVAELNVAVGDLVAASSATSAIVLSTPDTVYLNLTITESDITGVKAGQSGIATFDALENSAFPITLESIGTNPATTQGVVTYQARARILTGLPSGAAGALPSGALRRSALAAGTPTAGATPAPVATPSAAASGSLGSADTSATPLPGMNASVTIIVDQAQDVLMVPEGAIQSEGRNSVVEVQKDDGSTEKVVVQTGLSDGTNIEITQGLEEGQTIVIPSRAATASAQATQAAGSQQGGFRFFEGGPSEGGGSFQGPSGGAP
jgi:HlyD family secretion protein